MPRRSSRSWHLPRDTHNVCQSRRWHSLQFLFALVSICLAAPDAWSHDIPNQRVDRSIQVSLTPGRILIDYEVSLTELTLTQDLRALIGSLPGADRAEWLARYALVTGPLNAKGILVSDRRATGGALFP